MWKFILLFCLAVSLMLSASANAQINLEPGSPAPGFYLRDIHGQEHFLSDYVGQPRKSKARAPRKVVLLNFWGVNCKPCEEEIPYLLSLVRQYQKEDLKLILIAKDSQPLVEKYIAQRQLSGPIFLVDQYEQAFKRYLVTGIPMLYLIDTEGKIVVRRFGFDHRDNLQLEVSLRKLYHRASDALPSGSHSAP